LYKNPIKFGEIYGEKTATIILKNYKEFSEFNDQWFYEDSPLFTGLDLAFEYDELDEMIESKIENDLGIISRIKLIDGSEIKFLDDDDTIQSFYVAESDLENLKNQINLLVEKFR
jgi:hypothetical protein